MASTSKKSIKNEYAALFKTMYKALLLIIFLTVGAVALDGVLTATSRYQEHQKLADEYRQSVTQHILSVPKKKQAENNTDPSEENISSEKNGQDEQNNSDEQGSSEGKDSSEEKPLDDNDSNTEDDETEDGTK